MFDGDVIAAIATGDANSPIGMIRISGSGVLSAGFPFLQNKDLSTTEPQNLHRRVLYCNFIDKAGHTLDDALVSFFKAPHSFTGEDVVEIALHGNQILLKDCLKVLGDFGIRPAGPGEFSRRAYLNDKMDLSQAEAIQDLISAQNRFALEKSRQNLNGYVGKQTSKLRSFLINLKADLEAELDFMDQDIEFADRGEVIKQTTELTELIRDLLSQANLGRFNTKGLWTVITGKPNVGKSTLLNLILGFERAIVSPAAGTTRDYLEEGIELAGQQVRLYDTAGIRSGDIDAVEEAGIKRSLDLKTKANIEIHVEDLTEAIPKWQDSIEDLPDEVSNYADIVRLVFYNKSDLINKKEIPVELELFQHRSGDYFLFGSLTDDGNRDKIVAALEKIVKRHFSSQEGILLSERIEFLLEQSLAELSQVLDLIKRGESPEYICTHLNTVLDYIGDITGRIDTEEVLGRIFSRFCIGK